MHGSSERYLMHVHGAAADQEHERQQWSGQPSKCPSMWTGDGRLHAAMFVRLSRML
jgi:hypothetical protein